MIVVFSYLSPFFNPRACFLIRNNCNKKIVYNMRSKKEMKQVALAFPMGVEHLEEVMFGIRSYAMEHGKWMFVTSPDTHSLTVGDLEGWSGDGAIGLINNLNDLKLVRGFNMPFVNDSGTICDRHP